MARTALFLAGLFLLPAPTTAAPLDSRGADRALQLALQAELGGDPTGARAALEALLARPVGRDEGSARRRLEAWLKAAPRRLPGLTEAASASARARTWDSLAGFDPALAEIVWARFSVWEPRLTRPWPSVWVVLDRCLELDRLQSQLTLVKALGREGIPVMKAAPFMLAVNVDASDREARGRFTDVRAQLEFVLTSTRSEAPLARFSRGRVERRTDPDHAARFAMRRVSRDAAQRVAWVLRRSRLEGAF